MTLDDYRWHVQSLERAYLHARERAEMTDNLNHWETCWKCKYQWQNAKSYLRKREKREAA